MISNVKFNELANRVDLLVRRFCALRLRLNHLPIVRAEKSLRV